MWVPNRDRLPHHDRAVGQSLVKCLYILKYLEISWNVLKYLEISWNVLKYLEISWNILKYLEISWNILKCLEISWNVLKCLEMSWNILKSTEYLWFCMILWLRLVSRTCSPPLASQGQRWASSDFPSCWLGSQARPELYGQDGGPPVNVAFSCLILVAEWIMVYPLVN